MGESFVGLADVGETGFVEEDLLEDERGDGFGELAARFHDAQTERDDFRGEKERDDLYKWEGEDCESQEISDV